MYVVVSLHIGVFPKCFTEFSEFSDKNIFVITVKRLEPATSCVRIQDSTIAPTRQMLQLFISFPEFAELAEFNQSSVPSRKNSIVNLLWCRKAYLVYFHERLCTAHLWKPFKQSHLFRSSFFSLGSAIIYLELILKLILKALVDLNLVFQNYISAQFEIKLNYKMHLTVAYNFLYWI